MHCFGSTPRAFFSCRNSLELSCKTFQICYQDRREFRHFWGGGGETKKALSILVTSKTIEDWHLKIFFMLAA